MRRMRTGCPLRRSGRSPCREETVRDVAVTRLAAATSAWSGSSPGGVARNGHGDPSRSRSCGKRRLLDLDRLEATLQRGIFLDVLPGSSAPSRQGSDRRGAPDLTRSIAPRWRRRWRVRSIEHERCRAGASLPAGKVEEPSLAHTIEILKGLRDRYEQHTR